MNLTRIIEIAIGVFIALWLFGLILHLLGPLIHLLLIIVIVLVVVRIIKREI